MELSMASRQGSLDCLCGVYAVLNATEIVIGKFMMTTKRNKRKSQKRVLFNDLVSYLSNKNKLEVALTKGINKIDTRGGLLDIAVKSVKNNQKLTMKKQRAFDTDLETLDQYWEKLTRHLMQDKTAVIIVISGRLEHWTCVKAVTNELLVFSDSAGVQFIPRQKCIIGREEKGMYTLWPSMTYLLSI
jgi:hypothetical protein